MEEFDYYPQKPALIEHESRGKLSVTIFSMVLFILTFLMIFSEEISFVLYLVLVLVIHELGHFGFMKLFGYKNVRMLFIPFMGAFVKGSKSEYSQRESFLVVGAGPFPGIILGVLLIFFSENFHEVWMLTLGLMFLFLNLINLLPLDPLDGGQAFKLLVQKNNELFLLVFAFISSLILIGFGWFIGSMLLILFGFFMGIRVRSLQKQYQMHKDIKEEQVNFKTTYKRLTNREFSIIREIILNHTPNLRKYIDYAESEEVSKLMASQVNNVLVTPTKNDASLLFRIGYIALWIGAFAAPFWLYSVLDKDWLEYAFSNW